MRILITIAIAFWCALAQGQSIAIPGASVQWYSASSAFSPTSISGMAYYWNYNDAGTFGNQVTNWVDRIQGVASVQNNTGHMPTNNAAGVQFNGVVGDLLTNSPITIATNNSIWIVFKTTTVGQNYQIMFADCFGTAGGFYIHLAALDPRFSTTDHTAANLAVSVSYDFLWANGNTWTNAVSAASTPTPTTWTINGMGCNSVFANQFAGNIKFIGVWTNHILTASDASNLYAYSQAH